MNLSRYAMLAVIGAMVGASFSYAKPKFEGSIPLKGKSKSEYSSLAKISLKDAIAIATAQAPGKVTEAALEKEDGFLVYEVEVKSDSNGKKEFLIDAGTGKILFVKDHSQKSSDEDDDEND